MNLITKTNITSLTIIYYAKQYERIDTYMKIKTYLTSLQKFVPFHKRKWYNTVAKEGG